MAKPIAYQNERKTNSGYKHNDNDNDNDNDNEFIKRILYLTNRFHVAVRLFSNTSQMTSKCDDIRNYKTSFDRRPRQLVAMCRK